MRQPGPYEWPDEPERDGHSFNSSAGSLACTAGVV